MAEEKKSTPPTTGDNNKTAERLVFLLVGLVLFGAIVTALFNYLGNWGLSTPSILWDTAADYFFQHIWPTWKFIAAIVSVLALAGTVYNSWQLRAINIEEKKIYDPPFPNSVLEGDKLIEPKDAKWKDVMKYANSNNPSDWRSAIIEADVMLEKLLRNAGYVGESVGDMLKSVSKKEFLTIEDAWEAHKVRNAIAHSGGNFQLTEREAKRVIALFEKVFKEFQVI